MVGKGRHSVFRTWVVSYLAVLLLPLIFSYIVYSFAYGIIRNNTATINEVSLRQTEESVDRIFSEIRSTGKQILTDEKVVSLTWAPTPLTPVKLQKIGMLQSELAKRSAYGSYISEIYVYFKNPQVAASIGGIVRQDAFEKALREKFWMDLDEFERLGAEGGGKVTVKLLRDPSQSSGAVRRLAVFVSDAIWKETPQVTCMFIIDASHINNLLRGYDLEDAEAPRSVWAISQDGEFLSPNASGNIPEEVMSYCRQPDGIYDATVDGQKSALMSHTSDFTGWKFLSVVSLEHYRAQLSAIRNAYLVFLAFCLAIGVGISFYFAKRSYSPIERMTRLFLSELDGKKKNDGENEFSFLESGLSRLLEEKRSYEQQIGHQKQDLRQLWLTKMMQGRIYSEKTFRTVCEDYDISFSGDSFLLVGVTLQDCGSLISRAETTEEEAFAMVNFIVTSVLEELLRPQFDVYVCIQGNPLSCDYGDELCAVVNFSQEKDGAEVTARVKEQCKRAEEFIMKHLHITMKSYISAAYPGWEGISSAYQEISRGMEQMENFQIGANIATEEDIRHQIFQEGPEPEGAESGMRELCAAVSAGETETAWQLYIQVLRENIGDLDQSFFYLRLYSFSILERVSYLLLREPGESREVARKLKESRNIEELKALVLQRFAEIYQRLLPQQTEGEMPLQIAAVVEYIDTHFSDQNLTVAALAEQFSISQSYLLRMFKKSINTGVLEYISQRRVDEAKRLLKSGSGTVNEIAQQVGYANSLALIRAFKKLEGITPATYRKIV